MFMTLESAGLRKLAARLMQSIIMLVVGLYLVLVVAGLSSNSIIFQPQPSSYTDQSLSTTLLREKPPAQLLKINSSAGSVTAMYLPNAAAEFTLLFSHGNAEDIGQDLPILSEYRDSGFAVLAYDYNGYGTTSGHPSEKVTYANVQGVYNFATQQLHIPADHIIAMGRSLGSAVALELAVHNRVAGLVIEAPFLTAFRVLTRVPVLPFDKFSNVSKIRKLNYPVLIIHGRVDSVVPFWHGERLFAMAHEPKRALWIDGADHNDAMIVAPTMYLKALRGFAGSIQAAR
jgi:abhydrolase domain-containing protein 17